MKKHTTLKSKFNSAFSLVELLVVIAVIAIIAAIAIPNIAGIRQGATDSKWASDKASVERRIAEVSAAGGGTVTTTDVITSPGVSVTNEFGTVQTFFVETDFTAAELDAATPPSAE